AHLQSVRLPRGDPPRPFPRISKGMRWRHCGDARPECQTPSRFVVAHCQQQADGATETGELMPGYVIVWSEDAKAEIETLPAFPSRAMDNGVAHLVAQDALG